VLDVPGEIMSLADMLKIIVAVAASFGSGAIIVIALSKWLGDLWASRILQEERAKLEQKLADHAHELGLAKSSYDHYLDLILDYYKIFYRHYRLCQRVERADAHRQPDGTITHTRDDFLNAIDQHLQDWAEREGKIRILLPSPILATHMEAIDAFNRFKRTVDDFDSSVESHKAKHDAFVVVDSVKQKLESQIRDFLRTEQLLK
jgi:hypothetical protein